jgi:O-antigen/teichoic acid export membrane protein
MIAGRRHVRVKLALGAWPQIIRLGLQQVSGHGVIAVPARVSECLLGRLLGLSALGFYGRVFNLNHMIWTNMHPVIGHLVMMDLADKKRKGLGIGEVYPRTVEIVMPLLWPCFAGLSLLASPLIRTICGERRIAALPSRAAASVSAILHVSITMTRETAATKPVGRRVSNPRARAWEVSCSWEAL